MPLLVYIIVNLIGSKRNNFLKMRVNNILSTLKSEVSSLKKNVFFCGFCKLSNKWVFSVVFIVSLSILASLLPVRKQSIASQNIFSPVSGFGTVAAGTKKGDGFTASEVAGANCTAGTCKSNNSWNLGFDATAPVVVNTQIVFSYDLSSLGITGSQITELTFNFAGCWHGGSGRSCNNGKNPGFDSAGGKALFEVKKGNNWEQLDPSTVVLGTSGDSSSDGYATYQVTKSSGFDNSYLSGGIMKVRVRTTGRTTGSLDVYQVTDLASLTVTTGSDPSPSPSPNPSPSPSLSPSPLTSPTPIPQGPNFVVIETDDERPELLDYMPTVRNRIIAQGMYFTQAYNTTSLCCPSRSSFLSGQYVHNHGVWSTYAPTGGVTVFDDSSSIATWLKSAGYRTSLSGKYLLEYMKKRAPTVPPGWDDWHVFDGGYYGFNLSENGLPKKWYNKYNYSTDVLRDKVVSFIQSSRAAQVPFFVWYTPFAPHAYSNYPSPPAPAIRHQGTCDEILVYRPPSFNEADVSDKPGFVSNRPLMDDTAIARIDTFRRGQICAVKAVDEAVDAILNALGPDLDNTVVIFVSDNGFMWGEHRMVMKNCQYEECIKTPLAIRYPPLIAPGTVSDKFVLGLDLPLTIADLAGATPTIPVNGRSLVPLFSDPSFPDWRVDFLFEHDQEGVYGKVYGVKQGNYKYVEYEGEGGYEEFYDLASDPFELDNQINKPEFASTIASLKVRLSQLKSE